jgi:TolB protein
MLKRSALAPRHRALSVCALALALACGAATLPARADVEVDINKGQLTPLPVAIAPFGGEHGADIAQVVTADLQRSGYFAPVDSTTFPEKTLDVNVPPTYDRWRGINTQALVDGSSEIGPDGRLHVNFRLWDIFQQEEVKGAGTTFTASPENWRKVAHMIADKVYERLTGAKGYFDSKIVFVAESGPRGHRVKQLEIMDQDGANPEYLPASSKGELLTPRFSPSGGQEIAYLELTADYSRIWIFNMETDRKEALGPYSGQVFAPRFSADGQKVAFSMVRAGNTDIYVADLRTRETKRLTTDPSIDTSPSFSPDGAQITFNSDRSGTPQIYVMNADGSGLHRISRGAGQYNTPVWSPTGDWIAFTKQQGAQFSIGVMKPDGSDERILSTSYFEEGPTWAPNGRYIMFHREAPGVEPSLWTVDITGRVEKQLPTPGGASDPTWSPLLD